MPVATRKTETVRRELKTCPPDGYVVLRQLSFDEMLERRDGATKILMERGAGNTDASMALQIANKWSNYFSFPRCIVEHNLTDEDENPIDFAEKVISQTFKTLDPKIGAEIEGHIDKLNQEDEEPVGFTKPPSSPSPNGPTKPSESTD